jgi:hypothetical protein
MRVPHSHVVCTSDGTKDYASFVSSTCFSAYAICCSVNFLRFTACPLLEVEIMPDFLILDGTVYWGRIKILATSGLRSIAGIRPMPSSGKKKLCYLVLLKDWIQQSSF